MFVGNVVFGTGLENVVTVDSMCRVACCSVIYLRLAVFRGIWRGSYIRRVKICNVSHRKNVLCMWADVRWNLRFAHRPSDFFILP